MDLIFHYDSQLHDEPAKLPLSNREDGHHVVQGQEIHVNVVRPVTAELGFCLDMSHNT